MLLRFHWLALWLAFVTTQVASKSLSGAYEKIWFYYAYNLAWELDGPEQTSLLPFLTKSNQINVKNNANKGSLPDGQLNFQEFMNLMAFDQPKKCEVQLNSDDLDDLDGTARQIYDAGFGGTIRTGIATNTGPGTPNREAISYNQLIENLMGVVTKARQKIPSNPVVSDAVSKMEPLLKSIVSIRQVDFSQAKYLGNDIAVGFKLPKDSQGRATTVTYVDVPDPNEDPDSGKTVQRVDILATFSDPRNNALILEGFRGVKKGLMGKFITWTDNYGINPPVNGPKYEKPAVSHRATLDVWTSAKDQISRPVC
ncbi:hypothetical protein EAF04_009802 [Stromatinia cepivora]|nr:hypothetical protein EAF04_009802 [Stromatinia cepivora]